MARRVYHRPPHWDDDALEAARRAATQDFIAGRAAEGGARYREAFARSLGLVQTLFGATNNLLEFGTAAALAGNPRLIRAARYLGGPPISEDDLNTLADASIAKRKRLDADLARRAAEVIGAALDSERFPWLFALPPREPTQVEADSAMRWTAGLRAAQEVQTGRRGELATRQEKAVADMLSRLGFAQVASRRIEVTGGLDPGEFCREALVAGTKCDIPVGLRDGRFLFIECKVSNSATNSVKRLNREVGGKAREWRSIFGERAIMVAVLAGVYKLKNLKDAQDAAVAVFWERDLTLLAEFIAGAV